MSSLIANKVKNKYLFQVQLKSLYSTHYLMCHCSKLYHVYNNNYNTNCLDCYFYHTTIRQIFATAIFKPQLFVHTQHKADRILTDCCPLCLALTKFRGFAFSRILLRLPYCLYSACYVRILVYPSCLSLLVYVFDVFVSIYL